MLQAPHQAPIETHFQNPKSLLSSLSLSLIKSSNLRLGQWSLSSRWWFLHEVVLNYIVGGDFFAVGWWFCHEVADLMCGWSTSWMTDLRHPWLILDVSTQVQYVFLISFNLIFCSFLFRWEKNNKKYLNGNKEKKNSDIMRI